MDKYNKNFIDADVVIVGGGMVGLAMAASLANTGLSISLIEKSDLNFSTDGYHVNDSSELVLESFDLRVSAISPGNQKFLSQLNCWQSLAQSRVANYEKMVVWDAKNNASITFDAAKMALPKLGSIVENNALRAAILNQLKALSSVQIITNNSVKFIQPQDDYVEVGLAQSASLKAKLLIGADGSLSEVREKLNIPCETSSYQQTAFIANVKTEKSHEDTAWQRFTPYGPVAFLPLANKHVCSIVWSLDLDKAGDLKQCSQEKFTKNLAEAFDHRLGDILAMTKQQAFPLQKKHAMSYLAHRCVLIGDAAHTIHPLAGQGVNIGFQDVICLSELIQSLNASQRDYGLVENLRPFERERKAENKLIQDCMGGFKWLFGLNNLAASSLRQMGISTLDKAEPLKQFIMKQAMGL